MPSLGFEIDLRRIIGVPRAFCQRTRLRFQTGCCRNDPGGESLRTKVSSNLQAMRGAEETRLSDNYCLSLTTPPAASAVNVMRRYRWEMTKVGGPR